ncbi:MAG: glycosyltransferase family 4 protein [Anaerolineae bacterium]|nr:hypothetical protein [Anaerolineae bacterium]
MVNKPLHLVYIIGTYPGLTTTFIDREVRVLRQLGLSIQFLSIRRPPSRVFKIEEYAQLENTIIYLLPVNVISFVLAHLYFLWFRPIAYFKLAIFLFSRAHPTLKLRFKTLLHFAEGVLAAYLLRNKEIDHLHAHFVDRATTVALCVSRLLNLSYSFTAHANDIYKEPVLIPEKINGATFTVTVSEFNKNYLLQNYPGLNPDKLFVLHPWVDLSHFQPPLFRPQNGCFHIMSVGRLVEKKGHHYLIEACRLLREQQVDFECDIVGDGPLRAKLEAMVAQYHLTDQVHLLGGRPQTEVLAGLARADLFVLACVVAQDGDRDGMPVALAEAMAMAVPVISTNIVGIGELVQPGAGYLVPPDDAPRLAGAIKLMMNMEAAERLKMGQYARTIIANEFEVIKGNQLLAHLFRQGHC